jgi:uncharacterized membrane protein
MKLINNTLNDLQSSNLKGLWSYALGWISGIFFLFTAWENKYIRFHAVQSTIFFGLLTLFGILSLNIGDYGWIPGLLVVLLAIIMWKWLMWEAYSGDMVKLPLIGRVAGRLSDIESKEKIGSLRPLRIEK